MIYFTVHYGRLVRQKSRPACQVKKSMYFTVQGSGLARWKSKSQAACQMKLRSRFILLCNMANYSLTEICRACQLKSCQYPFLQRFRLLWKKNQSSRPRHSCEMKSRNPCILLHNMANWSLMENSHAWQVKWSKYSLFCYMANCSEGNQRYRSKSTCQVKSRRPYILLCNMTDYSFTELKSCKSIKIESTAFCSELLWMKSKIQT